MKLLAGMAIGGGLVLAGANLPLRLWTEGNSRALDIRGEVVIESALAPISAVRSGAESVLSPVIRLASRMDGTPLAGFGGAVQFQGSGWDGERDMGGVGWLHSMDPQPGDERPEIFAWTLQEIDGQPRSFVHWSAGRDGMTFYAPECGWWDGNCWSYVKGKWVAEPGHYPRPVARVGNAGVVNLIAPLEDCAECDR